MISSSTSFRRVFFSNIEELFNSIDDEAWDSCDCDSCDCRCDCDDQIRNEILDDRKKNASIMIKKRNLIYEFDDLQTKMIVWFENLINKKYYVNKERNFWFDDLNKDDRIEKI
jgi:hypothetical protein